MKRSLKPGRVFLFRLPFGSDLLDEIHEFLKKRRVRCGTVEAIGALSKATIGYYELKRRRYRQKTFRGEMELLSCAGNVSMKDGRPFAHLHAVLSDTKMRAFGGHVFPGSKVFAAEVCVRELKGAAMVRKPDPETGLVLWPRKP